jgi:hypothetical protein
VALNLCVPPLAGESRHLPKVQRDFQSKDYIKLSRNLSSANSELILTQIQNFTRWVGGVIKGLETTVFTEAVYIDLPYDAVLCNKWHYLEINLRR